MNGTIDPTKKKEELSEEAQRVQAIIEKREPVVIEALTFEGGRIGDPLRHDGVVVGHVNGITLNDDGSFTLRIVVDGKKVKDILLERNISLTAWIEDKDTKEISGDSHEQ